MRYDLHCVESAIKLQPTNYRPYLDSVFSALGWMTSGLIYLQRLYPEILFYESEPFGQPWTTLEGQLDKKNWKQ